MTRACPQCGKLVVTPGRWTCGASRCQEAEFYANRERNRLNPRRTVRP